MGRNSTLVGVVAIIVAAAGVLGLGKASVSDAAAIDRVPVHRSDAREPGTDGFEPRQLDSGDSSSSSSCFIGPNVVRTDASQADCDALVNIHIAVNGPGWINDSGWLTPTDPCSWFGVTCTPGVGVTALDLSFNALAGPLPAELGDLVNLRTLVLTGNELEGPIPPELGELWMLRQFALSENPLNSSIPDSLWSLRELELLAIENAGLVGELDPAVSGLTDLTVLALTGNRLAGTIPQSIAEMESLSILALADNNFAGVIPTGLDDLPNLRTVQLEGNDLISPLPPQPTAAPTPPPFVPPIVIVGPTPPAVATPSVPAQPTSQPTPTPQPAVALAPTTELTSLPTLEPTPTAQPTAQSTAVPTPAAPSPVAAAAITTNTSCVAGNGRVDVTIADLRTAPITADATYDVTVGTVGPRTRSIAPLGTATVAVTGRPDGPLDVTVEIQGSVVHTEAVEIDCDPNEEEALIVADCFGPRGRIETTITNSTGATATYAVTVGSLATRFQTIPAGGTGYFVFTGRPDGPIGVTVTRDASLVASRGFTIDCPGN